MGYIRARLASFSLSLPLLAVVGFTVGCGDNTPGQTGTGGSGGSNSGGAGGGSAGTGGTTDGGSGGVGGSPTDGGAGVGGGAGGVGGGIGGVGGGTGGVGGGKGGVGGGTGGVGGKGGVGGGTGGVGTGGVGGGTGGVGGGTGGGTGGTRACYTTAFTAPTAGAVLTVADDSDHTCANGFQYTVTITSGAPDGTDVTLFDGTSQLQTAKVGGGTASFAVQLATSSTAQQLAIQYPSTAACNVTENVTVSCPNSPPTCTISAPVISATHPDLNGVPTPQGDRSSSVGSPYQATFVVNTSAEDGQTVTLAVDNAAAPGTPVDGTPTATVSAGAASFGLTLVPDGTYEVIATCINKNGITGTSTKSSFTVDTLPPVLSVNSPTAGQFVVGGTINACAQTSSSDAASLAGSLGSGQKNLCVTLGSSATPSCVAVGAVDTSTCVSLACPGAAPFSLTFTLNDAAGNPTIQTVTGVTCASSLPAVQIVAPASDAPTFTDSSKHILATDAPVGIHDEDGSAPGAQADVVACTDTAGTATLFVGHKGDSSLVQLGTAILTTAATAGDNCPSGSGFVAHFAGVTLPQSTENADGTLAAATELQVSVTSAANSADTGTSLPDDVWVDTLAPGLAFTSPAGLCGSFTQSATTVTEDVSYTADDKLVVADVTNNGVTTTYDTPAYVGGVATFGSVAFAEGQNALVATESDPAGNATVLATCTVTIGSAPVVSFTTPTAGALLCPSGSTASGCIADTDPSTPGWQGNLAVTVTASGAPVNGSQITFSDGATTFGSALTDAAGHAQFNGVTIPEGSQTILATTDNVPGAGVGSGTVTVTVDTATPNAPTGLNASVPANLRRQTTMQLAWTAPSDGNGGKVAGYQIRYAKVPITTSNFNDSTVTVVVPYGGSPANPGQLDGINVSSLYIENGYYFAVEATNVAGTASAMVTTPTATTAHFLTTVLTGVGTDGIGQDLDGSGDFGTASGLGFAADGFSDLIVGADNGTHVYVYFGTAAGYSATPSITITGATADFGQAVVNAGDLDGDGLADIAIASPNEGGGGKIYIFSRKNPPPSWGTTNSWPATLTDTQANYVLTADPTFAGGTGSIQAVGMARLGNSDGTGSDDLAIGFALSNGFKGGLLVVKGGASFASQTIPGAGTIEIDGTAANGFFGLATIGIGQFFPAPNGPALVTAAAGASAIYAFAGQSPSGVLTAAAANDSVVGPAADFYGFDLGYLGSIGGSAGSVTIGSALRCACVYRRPFRDHGDRTLAGRGRWRSRRLCPAERHPCWKLLRSRESGKRCQRDLADVVSRRWRCGTRSRRRWSVRARKSGLHRERCSDAVALGERGRLGRAAAARPGADGGEGHGADSLGLARLRWVGADSRLQRRRTTRLRARRVRPWQGRQGGRLLLKMVNDPFADSRQSNNNREPEGCARWEGRCSLDLCRC